MIDCLCTCREIWAAGLEWAEGVTAVDDGYQESMMALRWWGRFRDRVWGIPPGVWRGRCRVEGKGDFDCGDAGWGCGDEGEWGI